MTLEGAAILNAAATGVAALCFGFVSRELWLRRRTTPSTLAASLFFGSAGIFLTLAAIRQLFGYAGLHEVDRALFLALIAPAGLAIVPLVFLAVALRTEDVRRAGIVAALFLGLSLVGLAFAYAGGITGPVVSDWGTEYAINSLVAKAMLILLLTLPGVAIGAQLAVSGARAGGPDGRRAKLVGVSCAVYYVVFTIDAFGLEGWALFAARLVTAGAAFVAYAAYAPQRRARVQHVGASGDALRE